MYRKQTRTAPKCEKREWHFEADCDHDNGSHLDKHRGFKKLRSGLLNTRERDAPAAQKAIMKRNLTASPFLLLPPEIRNRIYNFVLGGQRLWISYAPHEHIQKTTKGRREKVHVPGRLYYRMGVRLDQKFHIGLLRVCRQTYWEAASLPYALNKFVFENDWVLRRFDKTTRPVQRRAIGRYEIMGFAKFLEVNRLWSKADLAGSASHRDSTLGTS